MAVQMVLNILPNNTKVSMQITLKTDRSVEYKCAICRKSCTGDVKSKYCNDCKKIANKEAVARGRKKAKERKQRHDYFYS
jgi:Zn finger protein HypA/HybF involved in hydrogenase expression